MEETYELGLDVTKNVTSGIKERGEGRTVHRSITLTFSNYLITWNSTAQSIFVLCFCGFFCVFFMVFGLIIELSGMLCEHTISHSPAQLRTWAVFYWRTLTLIKLWACDTVHSYVTGMSSYANICFVTSPEALLLHCLLYSFLQMFFFPLKLQEVTMRVHEVNFAHSLVIGTAETL